LNEDVEAITNAVFSETIDLVRFDVAWLVFRTGRENCIHLLRDSTAV